MQKFYKYDLIRLLLAVMIAISLCLTTSSCNNLRPGEIARIDYEEHGCVGASKIKMTFFKKNGQSFANLKSEGQIQTVKIDLNQLKTVFKVIKTLRSLDVSSGCTSTRVYIVHEEGGSFKRLDEGCQTTGYNDLLSIFPTNN